MLLVPFFRLSDSESTELRGMTGRTPRRRHRHLRRNRNMLQLRIRKRQSNGIGSNRPPGWGRSSALFSPALHDTDRWKRPRNYGSVFIRIAKDRSEPLENNTFFRTARHPAEATGASPSPLR